MNERLGHLAVGHDARAMGHGGPRLRRLPFTAGLLVALAALVHAGEADACGACYASSSESTVVNDHKMAFAIQKQRTVLWDQISYSGDPREFAYVIPAKPGTRLEPSNQAWFAALDTSTRPIIMAPQSSYGGYGGGGDSVGCCSSSSTMSDFAAARGGGDGEREKVQVVAQSVVGPYETVTIRSADPKALEAWLVEHGYAIPPTSGPIIASYVAAGLDFIALRLQPGKNVRSMEPIRIVSPGTDAQLPLRMMQIGAGAKVGITLYVIGEGRYRTASFPDAPIDFTKLIWDYGQNRSNYQELSLAAMATENGRAFITEYADRPSFDADATPAASAMTSNTGLAAAYRQACKRPTAGGDDDGVRPPTVGFDAGYARLDAGEDGDAGPVDGGEGGDAEDAGEASDAGDASVAQNPPDAGRPAIEPKCDDLEVAVDGFALNDVWITRTRANLPSAALADTLRLEPAPVQEKLDNVHYAASVGTISAARVARLRASREQGTWALVAVTALVLSRVLRRKRPERNE